MTATPFVKERLRQAVRSFRGIWPTETLAGELSGPLESGFDAALHTEYTVEHCFSCGKRQKNDSTYRIDNNILMLIWMTRGIREQFRIEFDEVFVGRESTVGDPKHAYLSDLERWEALSALVGGELFDNRYKKVALRRADRQMRDNTHGQESGFKMSPDEWAKFSEAVMAEVKRISALSLPEKDRLWDEEKALFMGACADICTKNIEQGLWTHAQGKEFMDIENDWFENEYEPSVFDPDSPPPEYESWSEWGEDELEGPILPEDVMSWTDWKFRDAVRDLEAPEPYLVPQANPEAQLTGILPWVRTRFSRFESATLLKRISVEDSGALADLVREHRPVSAWEAEEHFDR